MTFDLYAAKKFFFEKGASSDGWEEEREGSGEGEKRRKRGRKSEWKGERRVERGRRERKREYQCLDF